MGRLVCLKLSETFLHLKIWVPGAGGGGRQGEKELSSSNTLVGCSKLLLRNLVYPRNSMARGNQKLLTMENCEVAIVYVQYGET